LDGRPLASRLKDEIRSKISALGFNPLLVSISVGENCGLSSYANAQMKVANELGISFRLEKLPTDIGEEGLGDFIRGLNNDKEVNGIIVGLPLPEKIEYKRVSSFIDPIKDVEGMHPENLGNILFGRSRFIPCTAAAVLELLRESGVALRGKEVVIVGHSEIIGKPLSLMLMDKFATVTVCHIATSEAGMLIRHVEKAEVLIVAAGRAGLIKGEWVKDGAVVIDVGINRLGGRIVGDVEFEPASRKASFITPVPGGVGPLTVVMLMHNLVKACKMQR